MIEGTLGRAYGTVLPMPLQQKRSLLIRINGFQYSCIFNCTIGFADSSHVLKGSGLE